MNERDTFDPKRVAWVLTAEDLSHLLVAIELCEEVILDLETTGLDEHAYAGGPMNRGYPARIVLASMTLPTEDDAGGEPTTWVMPLSHPESPWLGTWRAQFALVAATIVEFDKPLINQHVKFDAKWEMAQCGVDLSRQISWDTMVSSHLLEENGTTSLKPRAAATFGIERWDDFDLSTPGAAERVPLFDLGLYAARDTYWTWKLADLHRREMFLTDVDSPPEGAEEIEAARLGKLAVWCAMPTVATLTAIEQRGMVLDREWVDRELTEQQEAGERTLEVLAHRYEGINPDDASFAPTSIWFQEWTKLAVESGDLAVAELTPTGKPRWSKGVLVRQARTGSQVAQGILDLRSHLKKAEYLASWLTYVTPESTIHTTYWAGRVVTGRLSSTNPNMQQVTAALKPAFVPRPGYVFADLDYSQIELRVAAFISRCVPMIEAFKRGDDLHRLLAARITGKSPADVLPSERQAGKSANFGLLYGMQAYGFQAYAETVYGVSFTVAEAQLIYRTFFETWDGLAQWHAKAARQVNAVGQVVSPIGRVRRLPDIWDGNEKLAQYAERSAINSPVQGFASDLMQMAAASIGGNLPGIPPVRDAHLVATVHDDIVVEVPQDRWKEVTLECQERMTGIGFALRKLDCDFDVPLVAAAKVGTRWGYSDVGQLE